MYVNENFFETSTGFTVSLADSMHFKQIMQPDYAGRGHTKLQFACRH